MFNVRRQSLAKCVVVTSITSWLGKGVREEDGFKDASESRKDTKLRTWSEVSRATFVSLLSA